MFEAEDGEVYCKACYAVLFGHKRAKSLGPSPARSLRAGPGEVACLGCGFAVFEPERVGSYHRTCFKCCRCNCLLDPTTANTGPAGQMFCRKCLARETRTTPELNQVFVRSHVQTDTIPASEDDPDMCVRCGGKVFLAERRTARSGVYHSACFSCSSCGRMLESSSACEGTAGELVCSACHARKYTVTSSSPVVTRPDRARLCAHCGGTVVSGEEVVWGGSLVHRRCANTRPNTPAQLDQVRSKIVKLLQ